MTTNFEVLTVERAKELKGKTIEWFYFGYNPTKVETMVVGDIVNKWEYNKAQPYDGYSSRTEYWKSYMSEAQMEHCKNRLILLDADGNNTYVYCDTKDGWFKELTFVCSDSDREVYFRVID
jgi:hypothetical protein